MTGDTRNPVPGLTISCQEVVELVTALAPRLTGR